MTASAAHEVTTLVSLAHVGWWAQSNHASLAVGFNAWEMGAVLIAVILSAGVIGRWMRRTGGGGDRRRASLLQRSDCLLWEAEVELKAGCWHWALTMESTALSERLFSGAPLLENAPWWSGFDVAEKPAMLARYEAAMAARLPGLEEQFRVGSGNTSFWIRESVGITSLGKSRYRLLGLARDITTQREAELGRRASDEQVRQLLSHSDCMLWQAHVTEAEGGRLDWQWFIPDSELYRRVGDATLASPRMPWDRATVPEFAEMEVRCRTALREGAPFYQQEFRAVLSSGVLWLHEHVTVRVLAPKRWLLEGVTTNITAQRQAEEASRASEAQLQRIMDAAEFLLWHARVFENKNGELQWVMKVPASALYRKLFGRDPVKPTLMPWSEFVAPETYEQMAVRAHSFIRSGAPSYEQEVCGRQREGVIWVHEQTSIQRVRPGEWQLVGIVTDVTSRHLAEEARQASEQALGDILHGADCMLWRASVKRVGEDLRWTHFDLPPSRLRVDLLGTDDRSHTTQLWDSIDVPDLDEMNVVSGRAIRSGQAFYEQQFRAMRNGRLFWLQERVSIFPVAVDEWRLVGVVTDITRRHEAQAAQQVSDARLEELLRRVDCMIWQGHVTQQADGALQWQIYVPRSQLYRRIFDADPDGLGFSWAAVGVAELPEMTERAMDALLKNLSGYEQSFHIPKAGRAIWLTEQVSIRSMGQGRWEVIGVITDVTARREAEDVKRATEAQLQQILEMADCMVWEASVTHHEESDLSWNFYTPRSVLHRRLFGDGLGGSLDWRKLNVPERDQMNRRATESILGGKTGYQQEFRVVVDQRVVWLREAVTISATGTGRWRLVGVVTDISAEREAQEARKVSEAQVEQMLGTVECVLWQARVFQISPGNLRWVVFIPRSRLYREIFGVDPSNPARLHWADAVDEATNREINQRALHCITSGGSGYEQQFRAQRGERVFWLHEQASVVPIGPAEWKLVGVITDMTARREAEDAMRTSELRYRTLYQHIPMAIVETDFTAAGAWLSELRASGVTDLAAKFDAEPLEVLRAAKLLRFIDCNDTATTMLRARSKSDFNRRRGLLATADSLQALRAMLLAVWEDRNTLEAEIELRDFEGGLHQLHLRWWMEAAEGQLDLGQSVMVLVDVTRLKQAEAALAAEKERLAVTLRAMAEAVITTDVEGVVQFINSAAALFTGFELERAIGRSVSEVCRFENDRTGEKIEVPVPRVTIGDLVVDLPSRTKLIGRLGKDRLVEGCCAPIHSETNTVIGTVLVLRDVTEHERLEQELIRATRLESVGVLAGGIAHDFNNILTVVLGNVALASMDMEPNSAAARSLGEAQKATLRARDLTQQLLTFAKGGEPVRAAVQLQTVVREITTFTLHGSKVRPVFIIPDDLWPADVDKGQIGRVVQNLVINAVQAMPEGGTLTVALSNQPTDGLSRLALPPGDYVQIAITDSGVGIKAEYLPRIFDPYFTTKQAGSGLGLAAVYSIISKHRGVIEVESQVETGSTFRIWLPASHDLVAANAGVLTIPQKITMKGRVLFMDDEEPIRQMAAFLLRRFGFDVVCAADGREAVAKYREAMETAQPFVLVMVDLTVPGGMGGRQAMVELRQLDPAVKAIVSSGYSSDPVLANYREHGFAGVAAKPYEMGDLARVLREVLAETPGSGA